MQDRFRFRAWDTDVDEMYHDINSYDMAEMLADSQLIQMQCTGLKDKNGKLIYEGDIVKEFLLYKVIWENEFCRFELQKVDEEDYRDWLFDTTDDNQSHRIEVIGNIYENPELLEN